jgi:tetratricopeptide (TPR) repeat protein
VLHHSHSDVPEGRQASQSAPVPHYYLGKITLETSGAAGVDRAITHLTDATRIDSRYAPVYRELGLAYYRQGNPVEAIADLKRSQYMFPAEPMMR